MTEASIQIPVAEYVELIRATERIAALERYMATHNYLDKEDIISLLDIMREGKANVDQN